MMSSDYPPLSEIAKQLNKTLRGVCPKTQMHAPCKQCEFLIRKAYGSGEAITWECGKLVEHMDIRCDSKIKGYRMSLIYKNVSYMKPWSSPPKHCPYKTEVAVCMEPWPDWLPLPVPKKRKKRKK
jgi:hypothetical protein